MDVAGSSPLQIFVRAKKKINDIFVEIEDYARDTVTFMQNLQQVEGTVKSDDAVQVEGYIANVRAIQCVLTRNHMKVAFLGRTSSGKSSLINAMLREEILPIGFGHTTSCFLQVEESDSGESYLVVDDSTEKQNVTSVGQLADALSQEKLEESQLVHIFWPKDKCLLLRDDVVFVDAPGIHVSHNLDKWIDRYCLDADAFVIVINATSTLTLTEKEFLKKVLTRLSKPNIFILNNWWDVVATKSRFPDQVRAQHMEQAVKFLVEELKVCTQKEANQRIFFVSAEEVLQACLQEQRGLPAHNGALADGIRNRDLEFKDFEQKLEECISKSAVRTKFERHSERGKRIVSEIRQIMDSTYDQAQQLKTQKAAAIKEIYDKLNFTVKQLELLTQEMEDENQQMVENVKQKVSKALSEEIDRLSVLVHEFNLQFHSEQPGLNVYKKELHQHVENGLGSKLCARLSTAFAMDFEKIQQEMKERMSALLPAEKKQALLNVLPHHETFKIFYRLNCDNLCDDFHENLKFSSSEELSTFRQTADTASYIAHEINSRQDDNDKKFWTDLAVDITGLAAAGGHLAAGFEYLDWHYLGGQEREFKRQYVDHATKKLRLIFDLTSANYRHQVQQVLSETLAQLCRLVNEDINDMNAEIETLDKDIKQLEEAANSAEVPHNRAIDITKQLEKFEDTFLKLRN